MVAFVPSGQREAGAVLKEARRRAGMTQIDLARTAGVTAALGASSVRLSPTGSLDVSGVAMEFTLLDSLAENLLRLFPESATSLGVDKGERAPLRWPSAGRSR